MTNAEIIDLYDSNPNLTLAQLAQITGLSIAELKRLLMG
jgi:AraC-like DNA-binding protein